MEKGKDIYFYLHSDPEKDTNNGGMAMAPKGIRVSFLLDDKEVKEWPAFVFEMKNGEWTDNLRNNKDWRIYSAKMKTILEANLKNGDEHEWLPIHVIRDDEMRKYYVLHFIKLPDLLDMDKTKFLDKEKTIYMRAILDYNLIGPRKVFSYKDHYYSHRIILNEDVKREIELKKCTGNYFRGLHFDSEKLV